MDKRINRIIFGFADNIMIVWRGSFLPYQRRSITMKELKLYELKQVGGGNLLNNLLKELQRWRNLNRYGRMLPKA
ncbi:hypothetical protein BWD09_08140 [Neisseria dentiae]|uniref:Uncharacterized protein n=1 Tax=Neisseria dentiae TaxID=194197 RepID=A0A1X3D896_9NEIS|nr:hypothetical protein BWD09_08140 [Neisseria dentiae]